VRLKTSAHLPSCSEELSLIIASLSERHEEVRRDGLKCNDSIDRYRRDGGF
jgi:hypothetical protein